MPRFVAPFPGVEAKAELLEKRTCKSIRRLAHANHLLCARIAGHDDAGRRRRRGVHDLTVPAGAWALRGDDLSCDDGGLRGGEPNGVSNQPGWTQRWRARFAPESHRGGFRPSMRES